MTDTIPLVSPMRAGFAGPRMARIPEGWFLMGSDTGQDNERPVHRVWIDAFELAVCQVTNAEYALFLAETQNRPPLNWGDSDFSHPEQSVVGVSWFDATAYCEWLSRATGRCLPFTYRSGMGTCRSRRNGTEAISLGRRTSRIPAGLFIEVEARA